MAGFTYSTLTTAIQNYTEVGTSVLSSTITDQFIDNSELRIQREIPIDADRREVVGNLSKRYNPSIHSFRQLLP
jgi:PIN domain nuclease of toxin-antitoxin system